MKAFCLNCPDSVMEIKKAKFKGQVKGKEYKVECEGLICPKCGFQTLNPKQMDHFRNILKEKANERDKS